MQQFTARFGSLIQGVVSGFDRLLFRGSLRQLNHAHGMEVFLFMKGILFRDYDNYVKGVSQRVKHASIAPFSERKLPVEYLRGPMSTRTRGRVRSPLNEALPAAMYAC
jgi:hypothetical protein